MKAEKMSVQLGRSLRTTLRMTLTDGTGQS